MISRSEILKTIGGKKWQSRPTCMLNLKGLGTTFNVFKSRFQLLKNIINGKVKLKFLEVRQ
jgi:hypothetical protein